MYSSSMKRGFCFFLYNKYAVEVRDTYTYQLGDTEKRSSMKNKSHLMLLGKNTRRNLLSKDGNN